MGEKGDRDTQSGGHRYPGCRLLYAALHRKGVTSPQVRYGGLRCSKIKAQGPEVCLLQIHAPSSHSDTCLLIPFLFHV